MTAEVKQARKAQMRNLRGRGWSYGDIGERFGLTGARVSQILNGRGRSTNGNGNGNHAPVVDTVSPKQAFLAKIDAQIAQLQQVRSAAESLTF